MGLKSAVIVQLLPAAKLVAQLLDSLKLLGLMPERATLEMFNVLLLVLERVTV